MGESTFSLPSLADINAIGETTEKYTIRGNTARTASSRCVLWRVGTEITTPEDEEWIEPCGVLEVAHPRRTPDDPSQYIFIYKYRVDTPSRHLESVRILTRRPFVEPTPTTPPSPEFRTPRSEQKAATRGGQSGALQFSVNFPYWPHPP